MNKDFAKPLRVIATFLILLCLPLCQSCSKDSFDFSSLHAFLVFDTAKHAETTPLQSAMNPLSPGVFCRVSENTDGGKTFFYLESNQGLSTRTPANAEDLKSTRAIGLYNRSGVIVGYGNLSSPAVFYCYDSQCPNCYAETNMCNYKLAMSSSGTATCPTCKRQYDLNNNGLCTNADGKKLIKYRAGTTGPTGILSINN